MIKNSKKCKYEGCKSTKIWSKGFCRFHTSYQPIKKSNKPIKKYSTKGLEKKEKKKEWLNELHKWELKLWDSLEDKNEYVYCYETSKPMHKSIYRENLCIYSHCLPKSKYPQFAMEKWNILIVLPEIHSLWESNPQKCLKMWTYTEKIKEKYGNR